MTQAQEFTIHTDPGHGWIQVPMLMVFELGFAHDVTHWSYMDDSFVYLEEDCDARLFILAFNEAHGERPQINEQYSDNESFVRNLKRFDVQAAIQQVHNSAV